ncbi:nitrous oxide reductase accessory protein NosL [Myxococcota bacterium]|nr:nitrous oxide reductase accessory protein NosL [Myxococcota bacterium]
MLAIVAVVAVGIIFFPAGPTTDGPVPIVHGRDTCARCRMHIAQHGFAGQMRDSDGTRANYDDVGCLLISVWKKHREVPQVWVEAHDTGKMTALLSATLVVDSRLATPMGYGIIAFESADAARGFVTEQGGAITPIEALLKDGRRFRTDSNPHASTEHTR